MPIHWEELDSSSREEDTTIILGRNILLKIIENAQSKSMMNEDTVRQLLSAKNLCYGDVREPIDDLIRKEEIFREHLSLPISKELRNVLEDFSDPSVKQFYDRVRRASEYFFDALGLDSAMKSWQETAEEKLKELKSPLKEKFAYQFVCQLLGKPNVKEIAERDKELVLLDEKIKKKIGFGVLVPSNLLICPKCGSVLSTEEYATTKTCMICRNKVRREKAKRIFTHKVPDAIRKFWGSGLWLEAYVARLLRKLDFKTWVNVNVMGSSGTLHEVDVLAIRDGTVLISECKTGKVSRNDVFNFCTKVGDLRAHISILALIQELPEPETREFVKKNPAIIRIENMGQKRETDILEDLTQRLSLKG